MTNRKWAAAVELFFAAVTLLFCVLNVLKPPELPAYSGVYNAFLFQYGKPVSQLVVGLGLLAVGLVTLRAVDRAEKSDALHFIYEADIPMAPMAASLLLLIGITAATAILPYTGQRGIVPDQIAVGLALVPMMLAGTWFLLHHRRLAIVDSKTKTLEVVYGKPWAIWRMRYPFSDYDSVAIEVVPRARFTVHRLVALGANNRAKLVTFTFQPDSAERCAADIARETGWKRA